VKTASGYPATSVVGKPADAVIAALEALHLQPDVVISGTNLGQNFGPFSKLSGTVGAALTAARRGIPALASSADLKSPDFRSASRLVVDWVKQHRAELLSGKAAATVTSLNVPTCPGGPRGVVDEPTATDFGDRKPTDVDCASTTDKASFGDDVDAYLNGYAALSPVPLR
jgi:5'-nucleotidase